jgi:hypothetical protein
MRLFLILVMAAVAMAWRKWRARKRAEDAQRRLVQMLLDQAADEETRADREVQENLDI